MADEVGHDLPVVELADVEQEPPEERAEDLGGHVVELRVQYNVEERRLFRPGVLLGDVVPAHERLLLVGHGRVGLDLHRREAQDAVGKREEVGVRHELRHLVFGVVREELEQVLEAPRVAPVDVVIVQRAADEVRVGLELTVGASKSAYEAAKVRPQSGRRRPSGGWAPPSLRRSRNAELDGSRLCCRSSSNAQERL